MNWPEAKAKARAGYRVRRSHWTKWLIYSPERRLWFCSENVGGVWFYRVVQTYDFRELDFRATDWTLTAWPPEPGGGVVPPSPLPPFRAKPFPVIRVTQAFDPDAATRNLLSYVNGGVLNGVQARIAFRVMAWHPPGVDPRINGNYAATVGPGDVATLRLDVSRLQLPAVEGAFVNVEMQIEATRLLDGAVCILATPGFQVPEGSEDEIQDPQTPPAGYVPPDGGGAGGTAGGGGSGGNGGGLAPTDPPASPDPSPEPPGPGPNPGPGPSPGPGDPGGPGGGGTGDNTGGGSTGGNSGGGGTGSGTGGGGGSGSSSGPGGPGGPGGISGGGGGGGGGGDTEPVDRPPREPKPSEDDPSGSVAVTIYYGAINNGVRCLDQPVTAQVFVTVNITSGPSTLYFGGCTLGGVRKTTTMRTGGSYDLGPFWMTVSPGGTVSATVELWGSKLTGSGTQSVPFSTSLSGSTEVMARCRFGMVGFYGSKSISYICRRAREKREVDAFGYVRIRLVDVSGSYSENYGETAQYKWAEGDSSARPVVERMGATVRWTRTESSELGTDTSSGSRTTVVTLPGVPVSGDSLQPGGVSLNILGTDGGRCEILSTDVVEGAS